MGVGDAVRSLFRRGPTVRVQVVIRGRIGDGWFDVDRAVTLPEGTTLGELVDSGDRRGVPIASALEGSPHLPDTLMLNGERCPVAGNRDRVLADGDEIYLLAPLAGG